MIPRKLQERIETSLKRFPVVGLIGSRQTGKTTLAKSIARSRFVDAVYLDMERPSDSAKLQEAELYLEQHGDRLVIIDEIQRRPELFPLIRSLVDSGEKRAGRFLVLGSAAPSMIRQSSESLAGRIIYHELPPLSIDETGVEDFRTLWLRGGYPDSYLASTDDDSSIWREAFIRTYLERDIPQLGFHVPSEQLRRFWEMLAHSHAQLWNASRIAGSLGVTAPTTRRYLDILQDTFIIRQLQPYYANIKKRLVKSPKVYFRDSGLLHTLLRITDFEQLSGTPHAGASFEGWVTEQVITSISDSSALYFYRTSSGAEIDLVLISPGNAPVAIEIKYSSAPRPTRGYWEGFKDLKCEKGYVIYPGSEFYPLKKTVFALPAGQLWRL